MTELLEPFQALQGALRPDDRIVISGASGWMGRSLLHELYLADPSIFPDRILALGTHSREITVFDGPTIQIFETNLDLVRDWQPTVAVHLAYLTADRLAHLDPRDFAEMNKEISQFGSELQGIPSLRAFMFASSGAALQVGGKSPLAQHPYATQKALDEATYTSSESAQITPTLMARLWSVTGPHCTRPQEFAFSNMILQFLQTGAIKVEAPGPVLRKYVDAGEFLSVCLTLNLQGKSRIIDSAGDLVEIRDLARAISRELGGHVDNITVDGNAEQNTYYSTSDSMSAAAIELGVKFTNLKGQISRTKDGLASFLE